MNNFLSSLSEGLQSSIVTGSFTVLAVVVTCIGNSLANRIELRKAKLSLIHQDRLSSDAEYASMINLVVKYIYNITGSLDEPLAAVAALRIKETGELGEALDKLYADLLYKRRLELESSLNAVIEMRRKHCK